MPLTRTLLRLGADPARLCGIDIPYTANEAVRAELRRLGIPESNLASASSGSAEPSREAFIELADTHPSHDISVVERNTLSSRCAWAKRRYRDLLGPDARFIDGHDGAVHEGRAPPDDDRDDAGAGAVMSSCSRRTATAATGSPVGATSTNAS